ncbi:unnamed protein product [Caenorhabditis bovis]|uniref:Uncharacterized protein n=1 Tax=Caenorhabditis bovis TaxID=2654633 RepID=A0A8S1E7Z2_9PELO|nr:unnamed protein product [Caenorhabditis bovis]
MNSIKPPIMMHLNRTFLENETQCWNVIYIGLIVEIPVLVLNIIHTIFFGIVNARGKQFHQNWTNIMTILFVQHTIATCIWLYQRIQLFRYDYEEFDIYQPYFVFFSYVRFACLFQGLMVLPFLSAERVFASILLEDYSYKPREYISTILIIILFGIGVSSSILYHNVLRVNMNRFNGPTETRWGIGLGERYQLSENIKVCKLVNIIVVSMGGFNVITCSTLFVEYFESSTFVKALAVFGFDISAFLYSFIFPYVLLHYSSRWKHLMRDIFNWLKKLCHRNIEVSPYRCELRDTFGNVMSDSSGNGYFKEIEKIWNIDARRHY